ncbi:ATP-binding cassette domain-containing protein [Rathayibacter sp. VKM Ac-2805]|uniref:ATP-binding cassette domain-containing protein n=1 Tax=Rathayibacter sp. VKM Ac-2805 TaxID=2609258 RepID=UPI00131F6503|nr:ATP-binding cassette domain-containing protein [Rathayibacter sp. VKM Ac-2805]QHC73014.1 ATP-binding cassette domain-containing protein [Rathayibacter sp. VKM Ac-2805]
MSGPLLSLRGVGRRYPGGGSAGALSGLDLDVRAGEFVAIVGRSGAGKSTLLNILGLLDSADEGEYRLAGVDVASLPERERDALRSRTFGFVFQDSFVLPRETVARNTALPLRTRGERTGDQRDPVAQALEGVALLPLADQRAGTLSGGERQRVAIARAVVGRPAVILADEPTGNLDSATADAVLEVLSALHRAGVTIVLITHSPEVAAHAQRRLRLEDGRVVDDSGAVPDADQGAGLSAADSSEAAQGATDPSDPAPAAAPRRRRAPHLADAVSSLLLSPARTLGILAAFVLAVAGLVTSVGMSAAAAQQISARLDAAALDQITVRLPAETTLPQLREAASDIGGLEGVEAASARLTLPAAVAHPERWVASSVVATDAAVVAVDRAFLDVELVTTRPSAASEWLDAVDGGPVALLGAGAAADLGIPVGRTGDTVRIAGTPVVVAGFVESSQRDPALAESILVSLTDLEVPARAEPSVVARTAPGRPAAIAESVPLAVDAAHPERSVVQTVADLRLLSRGVSSDLAANLLLVSLLLLVLVCLTSATSMFLAVSARTREIALRRAVGATRSDIRALFLAEGTVIGAAGAFSGLALGVLATAVLSAAQGWTPVLDPLSAAAGVLAGIGAGAVSAVAPALRAARIEPALALRAG